MDGLDPIARITIDGARAVSPAARIGRRRRDEEEAREQGHGQGRRNASAGERGRDDEAGDDGGPHVDVLA